MDRSSLKAEVWERLGKYVPSRVIEEVIDHVLDILDDRAERVFRVASPDGQRLAEGAGWSKTLKRMYPTENGARIALRHYEDGAKVQRAAVVWEDVQ